MFVLESQCRDTRFILQLNARPLFFQANVAKLYLHQSKFAKEKTPKQFY
jgi:hypothetical protein